VDWKKVAPGNRVVDLASLANGGLFLDASDTHYGTRGALIMPDRAKNMGDGWETQRRRGPGHDWAIVRLGAPGIVSKVEIDTNHYKGNYPDRASLDGCLAPGATVAQLREAAWSAMLPETKLSANKRHYFSGKQLQRVGPVSHVRLNIFPDGGVARLRVYGDVLVDWKKVARGKLPIDLASIKNGGLVLTASDMHFGAKDNLIMPGRAKNMGDGWETRRRRGPGYDWAIVRLGAPGVISKIEIDTNHFKGNYPESASVEGATGGPGEHQWAEILPRTKLGPHRRHLFAKELRTIGPVSHVRLNIYPDGGVSRFRVHGTLAAD
jgi:allantoicase